MKFVFDDKISCMISDREISQMNKEAFTSGDVFAENSKSPINVHELKTKGGRENKFVT